MTETNDRQSKLPVSRGCAAALVVMTAIAGLLVVGIPHLREQQRLSFERQKAEWRQQEFDRVKNGDHRAAIMDSKLLSMLARDADCIANLNELNFSMTQVTRDDAKFVSQFKNVQTLSFYDTHSAELILEHARDLPITEMRFEMARLSKDALRSLTDFPHLTKVRFGHVMYPNEIAVIKSLPERIAVHIPYPAENEPGFKERGEPSDAPESP